MSRRLALAAALLAASLATGCSEPAAGHCTGTLAGKAFDADIDPESEHHAVQRQVCTQSRNKTRWNFSYGEGALQITALSPDATASIVDQTITLGPDGLWFEEWKYLAPRDAATVSGWMKRPGSFMDLSNRLKGAFRVDLADGSALDCSFELPKANDEGVDIDCPDEHTSSHHDDWD